MNTGNSFDGAEIESIYESPYMPISDPQIRKTFYKMTLYTNPTGNMSLDLNLKFDFASPNNRQTIQPDTIRIDSSSSGTFNYGAADAVFGTATFGGDVDQVYNKNVIGSGKTIAIRIEDLSTNPTYTLDTAILEFSQEDRQ
jgi:hypothetical protein